jgi:ACR3 family arsenite transporter
MALLLTLILLFSFQGEAILDQPVIVLLLALPILVQVYFNSMLAYGLNKIAKEQFCIAGPSALIGASNFFELAVATALALFGLNSGFSNCGRSLSRSARNAIHCQHHQQNRALV